ncbi:hypothetical protein [Mycolicibacterium sp. PDY-3]|uniref:hypothetical protein n=1 Tax=Mycolicibacterium sp. PDY-3 TaxID=3376069 RepID=UPI0037983B58
MTDRDKQLREQIARKLEDLNHTFYTFEVYQEWADAIMQAVKPHVAQHVVDVLEATKWSSPEEIEDRIASIQATLTNKGTSDEPTKG